MLGREGVVGWGGSTDCWLWFIKDERDTMEGGYIDGRRWWVMEEELWTSIVHRLWIQTGGSCSMVGSSEVNCLWIENTLNPELWTLNSEPWTLNFEPWTLNPGRGSCNEGGSLKRISVLLTSLSIVGVVDLEVCCSILGTFHSAPWYFNFIDRSELSVGRVPHTTMLEMLKIFWKGYHLLLQLLTDKVNYLWIDTARNPSGIDITRALLMLRNWRQLWLRKKDSWLMVGMVLSIGREMDGWSDLGCADLAGGMCLHLSTF